uniref:Huntingtin n=1 Tax=Plectus sambesii TaxID=2011161 RepID=A0A914VS55_9BILA
SLRLYTSSVTLSLQQAVLALLSQLVQDRVNYSLLDTDHRFLQFLYQQLDAIEQGTFRDAQTIVPTLFEFLLLLSYERSQNRQIVEMPKILQLCDSLVASGQNLDAIVIPALHSVVLDLFFVRPGVKVDPVKDIEMQQEVIASLLMKHLHNSGAMELLALVLWKTKKDGEEVRWKRLSRDFVDRLLPALAKDQIDFDHFGLVDPYILGLKWSCPSAFRPADELLRTIFLVWNEKKNSEDIARRFDSLSPCMFAALFLCKEDTLLTRMDELHLGTEGERSEVTFAKLLYSVASGLSTELLRRSSSALDESTATERRLQWFLHLVCHSVQSSYLRKVAAEFASIVSEKGLDFLLDLHKVAPRIHVQWLTLLNAIRLFSDFLWLPNLALQDGTSRHLVLLLYSDQLLLLLNENQHEKVMEFFRRNAGDLVELSLELPILEFFRLAFQERDLAATLADSIAQLLAIDTPPTFARKALALLSHAGTAGVPVVALRLVTVGLRSKYPVVAKLAEHVFCKLLDRVVECEEDVLTEETTVRLASGFDRDIKLRHPLACAALRKLISARFASLSTLGFDSIWTAEERNDLTPSGPPNKFNRLKFIRLLQSAIRIGGAYSSRSIAEALATCTLEEMNEILSTEGVRPELLLACLRKVTRLQSEAWIKADESPVAETAVSPLLMAVKASLFGNLNRFIKERISDGIGVWCAPTSILIKMLSKQSMTSFLLEQDVSVLVGFVDGCLKNCVTNGRCCLGEVTRVLRCAVVVLSSPVVSEYLATKKDTVGVQFSVLASFEGIHLSVLMSRGTDGAAQRQPLPFTLPEDVGKEAVRPFIDAWYTVNSLLRALETDTIAEIEPKKLRLALKDAIVVAARLPAFSSFSRVPPAAFRFGWCPEAKWNGTCLSLPTTPVHHLQNVDVLRQFVWRLCWTGWTNRQVFEEVWMALLGVLSATPIGEELNVNQSQSQQDVTERVMSSALAVNCLTALLLQNLMAPQAGNPLVSEYVIKHRDKPSSFVLTKNGRRLAAIKARIIGQSDPSAVFRQNLDRPIADGPTTFSFGQMSVDAIWGLTGVLAEERTMVGQKTPGVANDEAHMSDAEDDEGVGDGLLGMAKSPSSYVLSTINNHDLIGYVRTLLDLYQHWLREGADAVPIALLSATVESLVIMSDLFADTDTYRWLRRLLKTVHGARASEDELLLQWLLFGLLKCTAVVGLEETDGTKEMQALVEAGLNSPQMAVRLFAVHGVLYLLQSLSDDEILPIMPSISDFVSSELDSALTLTDSSALINRPQSFAYRNAMWTVAFYLVENCSDPYSRQNFVAKFMEQCSKALISQTTPIPLLATIVGGMESLLIASPAPEVNSAQISRLATGCLQRPPLSPEQTRAALQLLITCLYTGIERRSEQASNDTSSADPQLSAMEQLIYLFNKVSSGVEMEADAVAEALPFFLIDNFNPGDVMNRVLSELLAVHQQRPRILLVVIAELFKALWSREAPLVVGDWALLSLPTFTHKSPATFAVWSLTVFLSCASANQWIGALYPLLLDRSSDGTELDEATVVFLIKSLRDQLQEKTQLESLRLSLKDAAQRLGPQSAFSFAAAALDS